MDTVDHAELQRLLAEHDAPGEEQVERLGRADEARQHPRASVLGDQAAAHEGSGQLRAGGGEAQVAHQRHHEAQPGGRAVDGGDDRLGDRQRQRLRTALRRGVGCSLAGVHGLKRLHVRTGTEAAAGAGDDDDSHLRIASGVLEQIEVAPLHLGDPRVEAVRAVEGEHGDAVGDLAHDHFGGFGDAHDRQRYRAAVARFRQAVLAADDLDAAVAELRAALPLGEPFSDPGVALFGLRNAVMALGDTFVEVVSPVREATAAGRFLERRGAGPYMAMFEVDDLAAARARAAELNVREVWSVELPDISAVHLHPSDVGAAIVSLDQPLPPGSWRWAGPEWEGRVPSGLGSGSLTGVTLRAPAEVARRWSELAGVPVLAEPGEPVGIAAFHAQVPGLEHELTTRVAGAEWKVQPISSPTAIL